MSGAAAVLIGSADTARNELYDDLKVCSAWCSDGATCHAIPNNTHPYDSTLLNITHTQHTV